MTRKKGRNYYDRASALATEGVVAAIHLDPKRLTVRIRNGAKRMLQNACISGGYQSQTAKVAELLSREFELGIERSSTLSVTTADKGAREAVAQIREADIAAFVLRESGSTSAPYRQQYVKNHQDRAANDVRLLRTTSKPMELLFLDGSFRRQALRELLEASGGLNARIAVAVAALERGEPLPLNHLND